MEGDTLEDIDYCRNLGYQHRAACLSPRKYVNAYLVSREYGGPEEGGWWYDVGTPLTSMPLCPDEDEKKIKTFLEDNLKCFSTRDVTIKIFVEEKRARRFPIERPKYQ